MQAFLFFPCDQPTHYSECFYLWIDDLYTQALFLVSEVGLNRGISEIASD